MGGVIEAVCFVLVGLCMIFLWKARKSRDLHSSMERLRRTERDARIKALRLLKQTKTRIEVLEPETSSKASAAQAGTPSLQIPSGQVIRPIGVIEGVWPRRNGTPRQACLVPSSRANVVFYPTTRRQSTASLSEEEDDDDEEEESTEQRQARIEELGEFSHVWIIFLFHFNTNLHRQDRVKPLIRPPRLGGRRKIGMYATRTPHRPNNIGISLCKVRSVSNGVLQLSGIDLVSGTPVLEVKPFVRSPLDTAPSSIPAWLDEALERRSVSFSQQAETVLAHHWTDSTAPPKSHYTSAEQVRTFLVETLSYDIRGYRQKVAEEHAGSSPTYKVYLDVLEVLWLMPDAAQKTVVIEALTVIDPLDIPYPVDEEE